ncbi:MAG: DUF2157 domain-containing protein [Ginsengibacter sp.]
MDIRIAKKLFAEELITASELEKIELGEQDPLSVHWDLRTLLYLGIVLLTTATGILVYKNLDTIGHDVIIISIALLSVVCFLYCFKNSTRYSNKKIISVNTWFDYVLLMGCLLLLSFIGYLQFEYNFFGNQWGLATFIPMALLFSTAYYFDHLGVLSLAIVTLATWVGISVTPLKILKENDFENLRLIYSALILGTFLIAVSYASVYKNIKAHFQFTYKNFGINLLLIGLLAAMFHFENYYFLWFLVLAPVCFLIFKNAIKTHSFYFLVITVLYAYIGLSYVVVRLLTDTDSADFIYPLIIYFILSGIGLIWFFIHYNKILKKNDGI